MGETPAPASGEPLIGPIDLAVRGLALRGLEAVYRGGLGVGAAGLFVLGGFVPVARGWLRDEIGDWPGAIRALGGVPIVRGGSGREGDLGLPLAPADAPTLRATVEDVARRVGVRPPERVRLAYVPCCGVIDRGPARTLLVGLPLLQVLNPSEFQAVIAHELAHLAWGDAARTTRAARFVDALARDLDDPETSAWGPLRAWALACRSAALRLLRPMAWGQEARADRLAAAIVGGPTAASALVAVALVQPLFQEVLAAYDPAAAETNLYAFFRRFWTRIPEDLRTDLRYRLMARTQTVDDSAHPPLLARLAILQRYPDRPSRAPLLPDLHPDPTPAATLLGDPEAFEQTLHDRLFGVQRIERSVFHRAGS